MVRKIGVIQVIGRTLSPAARAFHRLLISIDVPGLLSEMIPPNGPWNEEFDKERTTGDN